MEWSLEIFQLYKSANDTYIMNFFNKYKDLFGVPDNTSIPKSKLSVNNNLFIDKPFVPTYQETLSINSKLRDLRKDYNELESQIQSINIAMKSPNRALSRKGKEPSQRNDKQVTSNKISPLQNSRDIQQNKPYQKLDKKNNSVENILNPRQDTVASPGLDQKNPFVKKRMTWLKDDQVNLSKHSQMNYIFNHKIKQQYPRTKNIADMPMPKAQNFMFGSVPTEGYKLTSVSVNQTYQPTNRPRIVQKNQTVGSLPANSKGRDSSKQDLDYSGALKRREEAKKNLKSRRQKLGYIYRTSW